MSGNSGNSRARTSITTSLLNWFEVSRSLFISFAVVALIIAMVLVIVQELRRDSVVMEAITLPDTLIKRGFTAVGTTHWLSDHISRISDQAETTKSQNSFQDQDSDIEIVVPGSGISLQSISKALRVVLGMQQTRVAGEILCGDPACGEDKLEMRLRIFDRTGLTIIPVGSFGEVLAEFPDATNFDPYFEVAAIKLLEYLDPYVVVSYSYQTKKSGTRARALQMVRSNHPDRAWAANLIGLMLLRESDYETAEIWLDRAIKFSQEDRIAGFTRPIANYGYTLHRRGEFREAIEKYQIAIQIDPKYANVHYLAGLSYTAIKKHSDALASYRAAAKLAPTKGRNFQGVAMSAMQMGQVDLAEEQFAKSAEVEPLRMDLYDDWVNFRLAQKGDFGDVMKLWAINLDLAAEDLLAEDCGLFLKYYGQFRHFSLKRSFPFFQGELFEHKSYCEEELGNAHIIP